MKHYNPSITERANRIFNLKNGDGLSEKIDGPVAVIPIQPVVRIIRNASASNSTTNTIYTTPADKDFYLTAVSLTVVKDGTATSTISAINASIDGVSQRIVAVVGITLTAQDQTVTMVFNTPIKIDRNSGITVTNGTNVANVLSNGIIHGYTEEVTRT